MYSPRVPLQRVVMYALVYDTVHSPITERYTVGAGIFAARSLVYRCTDSQKLDPVDLTATIFSGPSEIYFLSSSPLIET